MRILHDVARDEEPNSIHSISQHYLVGDTAGVALVGLFRRLQTRVLRNTQVFDKRGDRRKDARGVRDVCEKKVPL